MKGQQITSPHPRVVRMPYKSLNSFIGGSIRHRADNFTNDAVRRFGNIMDDIQRDEQAGQC